MECKNAKEIIYKWLEGKGELGPSTLKHIKRCETCQEFLRTSDPLHQEFQKISFSPPPYLLVRIKERLKVLRKRKFLKRVLILPLVPALAAVILFLLIQNRPSPRVSPIVAQTDLYKTHHTYKVTSSSISDPGLVAVYLSIR